MTTFQLQDSGQKKVSFSVCKNVQPVYQRLDETQVEYSQLCLAQNH